jgi:hypothetical protein
VFVFVGCSCRMGEEGRKDAIARQFVEEGSWNRIDYRLLVESNTESNAESNAESNVKWTAHARARARSKRKCHSYGVGCNATTIQR